MWLCSVTAKMISISTHIHNSQARSSSHTIVCTRRDRHCTPLLITISFPLQHLILESTAHALTLHHGRYATSGGYPSSRVSFRLASSDSGRFRGMRGLRKLLSWRSATEVCHAYCGSAVGSKGNNPPDCTTTQFSTVQQYSTVLQLSAHHSLQTRNRVCGKAGLATGSGPCRQEHPAGLTTTSATKEEMSMVYPGR